jgi:hypothetical protein
MTVITDRARRRVTRIVSVVPLRQCRADPRLPLESHRAALLLERQRNPAGMARERDLRKMYTGGATPEQAAEQVQVHYYNTRSATDRRKEAFRPWAAHRTGDADTWLGFRPRPGRATANPTCS